MSCPVEAAKVARQERHLYDADEIPLRIAPRAVQREIRLAAGHRRVNVSHIEQVRMIPRSREIVLVTVE